jgi:hypothetical protein
MEYVREEKKKEFGRKLRDFVVGSSLVGVAIWIAKSGVVADLFKDAYNSLSSLPQNVTIAVQNGGVATGSIVVTNSVLPYIEGAIVIVGTILSFAIGTYLIGRSLE